MKQCYSHLFLGGARSGKSGLALSCAEQFGARKFFLATAQAFDAEMSERIALHQQERSEAWKVLEEPLHITAALNSLKAQADVVILDCLTIWISNYIFYLEKQGLSYAGKKSEKELVFETIIDEFNKFCTAMQSFDAAIILVSNEVGLSLVPETSLGRFFRDLAGKINQIAAAKCQKVSFVAAGLSLELKGAGL